MSRARLPIPPLPSIPEGDENGRLTHYEEMLSYFYFHPDHLGSSSYMTNGDGRVSQHMEYLPFGETLVDEHVNSNNSPFKFNGKEYDEETGNYYYSARYYDPKLSIFISVDPLVEQTADAYGYCYQNPVKFVDPTGMSAGDSDDLYIKGADADVAVKELNDDSELNLVRDATTGKVTMSDKSKINYETLSCEDQELYNIIENKNKSVNINTTQDIVRAAPGGNNQWIPFIIGSFSGASKTRSFNEINLIQALGLETHGIQTAGASIRHEIFEGSFAIDAANSPIVQAKIPFTKGLPYRSGHSRAIQADSNYNLKNVQKNQFYLNMPPQPQPLELWFNPSSSATNTSSGWVKIQ